MKICYINYISPLVIHGGAERVVLEEAKMMADSGNEVFIISLKHPQSIADTLYFYNRKIRNIFLPYKIRFSKSTFGKGLDLISSFYNPIALKALQKVLVKEKPDIVHIHQLGEISTGALKVIKQLGIKIIQTFHGYYFECPRGSLTKISGEFCDNPPFYCKFYREIYRSVMESCDHIIAISSYVKFRLLNAGYNPDIITVLPNSINFEPGGLDIEKPKTPKEILFVGRMVKAKGVQVFLRALTKIQGVGEKYIVNLIGDGEDYASFQRLAKLYSLQVNFLGKISDELLKQHYKKAWVVVVPSLFPELCPMVPLEAATYSCPVIASDIGGMPDVVLHGKTGFLFNPNDDDELAIFLENLLTNEELALKMGSEARRFVESFTTKKKLTKLLEIYNKILYQ